MIHPTNRLSSHDAGHDDPLSVITVPNSLANSSESSAIPKKPTYNGFVSLQAQFVLENDLSLVFPLNEEIQQMITSCYGNFGESYRFQLAISLEEALTNAIIHGNLEISSELRVDTEEIYDALIKQRPLERPFNLRRVHLSVSLDREKVSFVIRDQGSGFPVSQVPDPTTPENLEKVGGRGLALMRNFMDEVIHNPKGNVVTMIKRAPVN